MRAEAVMQDVVGAGVVGVVAGRHEDHRQPFGVRAGDAVERGERSDVHGGDDRAAAVDPSIGLGGIRGVELVAAADLLHVLVREQLVQQDQVVVAWDHEVVLDADLLKPLGEIVTDGEFRHDTTFLVSSITDTSVIDEYDLTHRWMRVLPSSPPDQAGRLGC